jgi:hypothetical protein
MIVLPTAKILLFIALNVGPAHAPVIYATSNSESYVWTPTETGWTVEGKGFPASDFTRDPSRSITLTGNPPQDSIPGYLRAISKHNWKHHNSAMIFDNGNRVEKHGDHAFYIINAGGPNEKIFTILFPKCD